MIRQARAQRNRHALAGSPRSDGKSRARLTELFAEHVSELQAPSVLELGTRQSQANQSTMHRNWVPHAGEFLGTDIEQGSDVDIVADVHRLSAIVGIERFDVILSFSTFEHLKYPQLAAHEVMQALRVGGLLLVVTHQTFPLHSYPSDYFRFSTDALETLFPRQMGFETILLEYDFPAQIVSRRDPSTRAMPAYLLTHLLARKLEPTPGEFRYALSS